MEDTGQITIHIEGKTGGEPIAPSNYDVAQLKQIIADIEDIIRPNDKSSDKPLITYEMQEGSVKHVFHTKLQKVAEFSAILSVITLGGYHLDGLLPKSAQAMLDLQDIARKTGLSLTLSTSVKDSASLTITPATRFLLSEEVWADAEFYFYGKLIDAGGKNKPNIHIETDHYGTLIISSDRDLIAGLERNPLYRNFGIHAVGKQNVNNGEIDKNSLHLVEIIDYDAKYDEDYISGLIAQATPKFRGIDADQYVAEIRRGGAYA